MSFANLLAFIDGSPATLACARVGAALANCFDARITGAFPTPSLTPTPWDEPNYWGMPPVVPFALPATVLAEHERKVRAAEDQARMSFEAAADAAGCVSEWVALSGDVEAGALSLLRRTDLAIMPLDRLATLGPLGARPSNLVLASGGPALLLPQAFKNGAPGRRIVVAWNGGREAARALRDAWPFLLVADSIDVVVVEPAEASEPDHRLQRYFEAHGCTARIVVVRDEDAAVATVLRDQVRHLRADLLVMGLYGHSRLRETVFGGVSRALLHDAPVPILVSH